MIFRQEWAKKFQQRGEFSTKQKQVLADKHRNKIKVS